MLQRLVRPAARTLWRPFYLRFAVRGDVDLGERVHIGPGSRVEPPHRLTIGDDVYIGKYCTIECNGRIGDQVLIANNVGLVGRHDHDHRVVGVGMRSAPWIGDDDYRGPGLDEQLVVESDVWIGYGSTVLSGVTIGRGAIVAAGSLVTGDVAPYDIVAGRPARPVGRRFDDAQIAEHERMLYGDR